MRNQTPIQQQRRAQTQQCRGRPHNPSITRRIQPSRQRASVMRQMQQQTRQRQTRQRQGTPLPEKRGETRQATNCCHANTTFRHMVDTHRHSKHRRKTRTGEERRGTEKKRQQREQITQWCSGITCVLAKLRAHYPEHQQQKGRTRGGEETENKELRQDAHHHHTPPSH